MPSDDTSNATGPYALVTGGSKGIGYAIAAALARRNYNLVLIARNLDTLQAAKQKLESAFGVHVELLVNDVSREEAADEIADWCIEKAIPLKMLCNVAGSGGERDYPGLSMEELRYMMKLNIGSCMALTLRLLPLLEKNTPSYVLNVASLAGLAPIPSNNCYSATKSAVIFFSHALHYQVKRKNISVSCLAPGPVFTKPSVIRDIKKNLGWFGMKMAVSPEKVGETAIRKTLRHQLLIIPGGLSKLSSVIIRLMPRKWIVSIYNNAGKNK